MCVIWAILIAGQVPCWVGRVPRLLFHLCRPPCQQHTGLNGPWLCKAEQVEPRQRIIVGAFLPKVIRSLCICICNTKQGKAEKHCQGIFTKGDPITLYLYLCLQYRIKARQRSIVRAFLPKVDSRWWFDHSLFCLHWGPNPIFHWFVFVFDSCIWSYLYFPFVCICICIWKLYLIRLL